MTKVQARTIARLRPDSTLAEIRAKVDEISQVVADLAARIDASYAALDVEKAS